ncbi:hypothetical protein [Dactylosporangium sp. NPDC048998]|uniref:hypothetical protein n=1 Tax=Dactylosporangium sp. NPDC048998 TaxID=3363976 RepID=UPI003713BBAB
MCEPVRPVPPAVWPVLRDALGDEIATLDPSDLLALSGRGPAGLPPDTLARIVDLAAAWDVDVIVDADGPALVEAVRRSPALVKVNAHEAAAATGGAERCASPRRPPAPTRGTCPQATSPWTTSTPSSQRCGSGGWRRRPDELHEPRVPPLAQC